MINELIELRREYPNTNPLFLIYHLEAEYEQYFIKLQKSLPRFTKYQALTIFPKEELMEIFNDKMIAWEQIEIFSELRNYFIPSAWKESKRKLTPLQINNAQNVPLNEIFDALQIQYKKKHCICPFCWWTNNQKFSFNDNLYYCFSCWVKGNSITFIKEYLKKDFVDAVLFINGI